MYEQPDETNWDLMDQAAVAATASVANTSEGTLRKQIFLKVRAGMHNLRLIAGGNKLDKLPFMRTVQHSIQVYDPVKGGQNTQFTLCWNFLKDNLLSKPDAESRKNDTLIGYILKQGKLLSPDLQKWETHKCPFCAAFAAMDTYGIEKTVRNKFLGKEQYLWNVFFRQTPSSGDNKMYIWGASKTQYNKMITSIKLLKNNGINVMHPVTGHDWLMTATGEGFGGAGQGRRYDIQVMPVPSPCDIGQEIPYDLAEVVSNGFKTYQESVNMLKKFGGELLQSIGYVIPGDELVQEQYASPAVVVPESMIQPPPQVLKHMPAMHTPVAPAMPIPSVMLNAPVQQPVPVVATPTHPSGATVEINGHVYEQQADGNLRFLF